MVNVITGPPSSGKTTLVEEFSSRGFTIMSESARLYIEMCSQDGLVHDEKSIQFQFGILDMQIKRESCLEADGVCFLDRAIPDSLAYLKIAGADITSLMSSLVFPKYDYVFFLDRLPIVDDGLRVTDEKFVEELERELFDIYVRLGYRVVRIPPFSNECLRGSVERRVNAIMSYI